MILFRFIIFFFIFFIFSSASPEAKNNINPCLDNNIINNVATPENILPSKISIEIKDNRKFVVNNLAILESNTTIKKKYKKRYSGKIRVYYKNNKSCIFKARIRLHGDYKDHIKFINGNIIQSLDVHLIDGNISGITKFKLFLPETKKNPKEEIIITEIFRSLNILAPRTFFINIDSQRTNYLALFQEKISKEFLEYNQRKEFILLEGDERFIYDDDKNDFGWESKLLSLAKVSNIKILEKSENFEKILLNSLSYLNRFYLSTKNYYEHHGSFPYIYSKLNDELLNKSNSLNQKNKFSIFNSLIFATNSQHALIPHNRKFYWNGEYQTFEPIYYDGNIDINKEINESQLPKNKYFFENIMLTSILLDNLDQEIITKKILKNLNVVQKNQNEVSEKISQIKSNLDKISHLYVKKNEVNKPLNAKYHTKNLKDYFSRIDNKNIYPIFFDNSLKNFYKCNIIKCKLIQLSDKEIRLLINGNLKKDNNFYQFVGVSNIENFKLLLTEINADKNLKIIKYQNSKIIYNEGEYLIKELGNEVIHIIQLLPNTRLTISGGSLDNVKIFANLILKDKGINNKTFGIRGLTGCINLIDLKLNNVDIEISNGNCEDAINIIRSEGVVNSLSVINSSNDAIDFDFSEIKILKLEISSAGNDCADLSYGKYSFINAQITGCGDKAVSVGEKSKLKIQDLIASNSYIGVASKDSSYVELENGNFNDLEICLSAYKKKQEFMGALIYVKKFKCSNSTKKTVEDKFSKIKFNN